MRWTNAHSLPAPLAAAIRNDSYKKVGWISATGLQRPPQMRVLEQRHWDKLTTDVSDNIFSLFGQVVHGVLERSSTPNELAEKRFIVTIRGAEISGQADLFESLHSSGGLLSDYKTIGTISYQMGGKDEEWAKQLNTYAYLFSKNGIEVKELQIVAILRDWSKMKAQRDSAYPQSGVHVIKVPLWPLAKTEEWLNERVRLHQEAEKLPDNQLPECSEDERWQKESTYAVKKTGRKMAISGGIKSSRAEADALVAELGPNHFVEDRPGAAIRCENYCKVKDYCHQYQKTVPEGVEIAGVHSGGY